jgi:hypothetical protein
MKRHDQSTSSSRGQQRRERQAPSALATFPLSFGRYRNVPLARIPPSYLRWMLTADVPDVDRWAVERYLQAVAPPRQRRPGRHQTLGHLPKTTTLAAGTVGGVESND